MRSLFRVRTIRRAMDGEPLSQAEQLRLVEDAQFGDEGLKNALWALWSWSGCEEIRPSYDSLAMRMNCHRRTAIRRLRVLALRGVIIKRERRRDDGGQTTNLYEIDFSVLAQHQIAESDDARSDDVSLPGGASVSTPPVTTCHRPSDRLSPAQCHTAIPRGGSMSPEVTNNEAETEVPNRRSLRSNPTDSRNEVARNTPSAGVSDGCALGLVSDSGSPERQKAWSDWQLATAILVGRHATGRHPQSSSQWLADRTSIQSLFDRFIWPEDMPPELGAERLTTAKRFAELANKNGKRPMAYLTKLLRESIERPEAVFS